MRKLRTTHVATFYFFWEAPVQASEATRPPREEKEGEETVSPQGTAAGGGEAQEHTGWPLRGRAGLVPSLFVLRWGAGRWLRFPVAAGTKPRDLGAEDTRTVSSRGSGASSPR